MNRHRSLGFTLIELLVVIAIIAVFVSLLLPGIQSARESVRRLQCQSKLAQLGLALSQYHSSFRMLPPGCVDEKGPVSTAATGYKMGWIVQILPMLDRDALFRRIDFSQGAFAEVNEEVLQYELAILQCPSAVFSGGSCYVGVHASKEVPIDIDNDGVLFLNSSITNDDITDGLAYTMFVSETNDLGYGWMPGTRATLRNGGPRINAGDPAAAFAVRRVDFGTEEDETIGGNEKATLEVGGFGSYHSAQGVNALFGDGGVRFLSETIDQGVLQQYCARADASLPADPGL